MKEIDYFSPIENRGEIHYMTEGSRRVTFEFNDGNNNPNYVNPNPNSGRGSNDNNDDQRMTLNLITPRQTLEEDSFNRGRDMVHNFQF